MEINYIFVHNYVLHRELEYIFRDKQYSVLKKPYGLTAYKPGKEFIMPEPGKAIHKPYHYIITTIYTTDETIVPEAYVINTYRGKEGYNIKYIEDLEI